MCKIQIYYLHLINNCYYKKQLEVSPCLPFPADHLSINLLFFHGRLKNSLKKLLTDNYTYTHTMSLSEKYHSLSLHLELKIIALYVTLTFILSTLLPICFYFTQYPKKQLLRWEHHENCIFFHLSPIPVVENSSFWINEGKKAHILSS